MKIIQYLIFTLILGAVTLNAQTIVSKNTIAKNTVGPDEKKTSAPVSDPVDISEDEKDQARVSGNPAVPVSSGSILSRQGVQTGETITLSLDEAIRKALANNNDIEVAKQNVKSSASSLRSLLGFSDPVFTISPGYSRNIQPQTSAFGGNGGTGVTQTSGFVVDSSVFHRLPQGGGNYSVFFNNDRSSNNFSTLTPTYGSSLGANFNQPLLRNFKIDQNRQQIRIQRKRVAQSDEQFRASTIDTVRLVQTGYWDLVFSLRDQQNKVENLNLAKENLRQVQAKIDAGASAPLARAEVLTELANREADVIIAAQSVSIAENNLKRLILRDPQSPEWSAQLMPTDRPVLGDDKVDLDAVTKDALANRPELSRFRLEKDISDINISFFKNQIKPRVDFNGTFSLSGLAGAYSGVNSPTDTLLIDPNIPASASPSNFLLSELIRLDPTVRNRIPTVTIDPTVNPQFIGGYGQSLQNLFSGNYRNFQVGVTIEFPLRNKTAKANLATAQIERTRLEADTRSNEQTVIVEVRNAVQGLESARQRVLAAREGVKNAEIQLEGQRKLFELGRSDTFLLFQRENQLALAKNSLIRSETDYNKAIADLQRATAITLTVNNIQIESPVDMSKINK
jgi:HAE1 family hydrophobic/amphiphilic exporter-1